MSTELKSELHITSIPRTDKARWVSAARKSKKTLAEWSIEQLNRAATLSESEHAKLNAGYYDERGYDR